MNKKFIFLFTGIILLFSFSLISSASYRQCSGTCYGIGPGENTGGGLTINSICYVITNNHGSYTYFVPLNTPAESQAFIDNLPEGISISDCSSTSTESTGEGTGYKTDAAAQSLAAAILSILSESTETVSLSTGTGELQSYPDDLVLIEGGAVTSVEVTTDEQGNAVLVETSVLEGEETKEETVLGGQGTSTINSDGSITTSYNNAGLTTTVTTFTDGTTAVTTGSQETVVYGSAQTNNDLTALQTAEITALLAESAADTTTLTDTASLLADDSGTSLTAEQQASIIALLNSATEDTSVTETATETVTSLTETETVDDTATTTTTQEVTEVNTVGSGGVSASTKGDDTSKTTSSGSDHGGYYGGGDYTGEGPQPGYGVFASLIFFEKISNNIYEVN